MGNHHSWRGTPPINKPGLINMGSTLPPTPWKLSPLFPRGHLVSASSATCHLRSRALRSLFARSRKSRELLKRCQVFGRQLEVENIDVLQFEAQHGRNLQQSNVFSSGTCPPFKTSQVNPSTFMSHGAACRGLSRLVGGPP